MMRFLKYLIFIISVSFFVFLCFDVFGRYVEFDHVDMSPRSWTVGESYAQGELLKSPETNDLFIVNTPFTAGQIDGKITTDFYEYMSFLSPSDYTTSVFSGGIVSYSGQGFDVSEGNGIIIRNKGTVFAYKQKLKWDAVTNLPPENSAEWNSVVVEPNSSESKATGTVKIVSGIINPLFYKENIVLGAIYVSENEVFNLKGPALDHGNRVRTLLLSMGMMKNGLSIIGNSDKTFQTTSGNLIYNGISPGTEQTDLKLCEEQVVTSFDLYKQDGIISSGQTVLDTSNYDNGGTLASVGGTKWSCYRVYVDVNCNINLQYCQSVWLSLNDATVGEQNSRDSFVVPNSLKKFSDFIGLIFFVNNATAMNDTDTSLFKNSGLFGLDNFSSYSYQATLTDYVSVDTFSNNWENIDQDNKLQYKRLDKIVEISGTIKRIGPIEMERSKVFKLPKGFRPGRKEVIHFGIHNNGTVSRIKVKENGDVIVFQRALGPLSLNIFFSTKN